MIHRARTNRTRMQTGKEIHFTRDMTKGGSAGKTEGNERSSQSGIGMTAPLKNKEKYLLRRSIKLSRLTQ